MAQQQVGRHYSLNPKVANTIAVLVLVMSAWSQVDFWCKALVPWQELRRTSPSAEKSLLADYISTNLFVTIRQAWKNSHWIVLSVSAGSLLLRLITVFSTALLVLQPTTMTDTDVPLKSTTQFDSRKAQKALSGIQETSGGPALVYAGIMQFGLSYPNGTLADLAYQTIMPARNMPRDAVIRANTVAFYPELDCEVANVNASIHKYTMPTVQTNEDLYVSFTVGNCSFEYTGWVGVVCDPSRNSCPERDVLALWSQTGNNIVGEVCGAAPDDTSLAFAVVDMRYEQKHSKEAQKHPAGHNSPSQVIANISGVVCKPRYSLKNSSISINLDSANNQISTSLTANTGAHGYLLPGFNSLNLTNMMAWVLWNSPYIFGSSDNITTASGDVNDKGIIYHLMMIANGHSSIDAFLDPTCLMKAAEIVFRGLTSQIASDNLLSFHDEPVIGQVDYLQNRLHVKILPACLMGAGFILMICVCLIILSLRPENVTPRSPISIAAIAVILASSESLNACLMDAGHGRFRSIRQLLKTRSCFTVIATADKQGPTFKIEVKPDMENIPHTVSSPPVLASVHWWRPLPLSATFLTICSLFLIALIVILEIIQRLSDRNDGILDISSDSGTRFLMSIIPAGVMSLITITFGAIDSSIRILTPYKTLSKGSASARRSISCQYTGKNTILALIDAVKNRHAGIIFSAFGAALASYLTIIVSGLYVRDDVPAQTDIVLRRSDQFNLTWNNSLAGDNEAGTVFTLLQEYNLSYPKFTFDELTMPTLQLPETGPDVFPQALGLPVTARIPALRASLNCSVVPYENITVITNPGCNDCEPDGSGTGPGFRVYVQSPLPESCLRGGPGANLSYIDFEEEGGLSSNIPRWAYMGKMTDLHVGPYPSYDVAYDESEGPYKDNPAGCPSLAFLFGSYMLNATSSRNTTVLVCSQIIEEIETDVSFILPNLTIDTANPPVPDESTARPVGNGTPASIYREYRLEQNLQNEIISPYINQNLYPVAEIDQFFQVLIAGADAIPPPELVGPENVDRVLNATQHLYRVYMAQTMDRTFRRDIDTTTSSPSSFIGKVTNTARLRLKQDKASKLTLQIILGVLLLLGALAFIASGKLSKVLTHNPCSIAGAASLLAGSEMVSRKVIPGGAEWVDDRGWERHGVFRGWLFSLGWWGDDHERLSSNTNTSNGKKIRVKRFGIDVDQGARDLND